MSTGFEDLEKIAITNVTKPEPMTFLRLWWTKKYRLPVTSNEWLNSYPEDIAVELLEERYLNDEKSAKEARLKYLGVEIATDDPLIDKWEREIARGETPDLSEGEDEKSRRRDEWVREQAELHYAETGERLYKAHEMEGRYVQDQTPDLDYTQQSRGDVLQEAVDLMGSDPQGVEDVLEQIPPEMFDAFMGAIEDLKG